MLKRFEFEFDTSIVCGCFAITDELRCCCIGGVALAGALNCSPFLYVSSKYDENFEQKVNPLVLGLVIQEMILLVGLHFLLENLDE